MHRIERLRQRKHKIRTRYSILGVAAIHAIAGEGRRVTEIFEIVAAVPALALRAANPRNAHSRSHWQLRCSRAGNLADNLMAGNQPRTQRRQFALDYVKIGPANTAGEHAQ